MSIEIAPPRMRISRRIKKDQIFKIKVKFDHPSFVGVGLVDEKTTPVFNRSTPVSFIRNMLVYYDEKLVSRFRMSSAIADNPLITFKMKATKEAPLKLVFVDNQGQRWETKKKIKFKK
jgi:hypothetical protein